jgi:hypothetical protein
MQVEIMNSYSMFRSTLLFLTAAGVAVLHNGCERETGQLINGKRYYTEDELLAQEKFRGYTIFTKPVIEGPWRVTRGVWNTVPREGMPRLHRSLEFEGKEWEFEDKEAQGYGYRFLAVENPQGEKSAIMLKTIEKQPDQLERYLQSQGGSRQPNQNNDGGKAAGTPQSDTEKSPPPPPIGETPADETPADDPADDGGEEAPDDKDGEASSGG